MRQTKMCSVYQLMRWLLQEKSAKMCQSLLIIPANSVAVVDTIHT